MLNYKKYIKFLKKEFKEKLDSTDNKLEKLFGNTLNNHINKYLEQNRDYLILYSKEKKWLERKQQISTKKLTVPKGLFLITFICNENKR